MRLYEFDHLKQLTDIVHGVFARTGGVSNKPFDSLNVGINSGDIKSAVIHNRKLISRGFGDKPLIFLNQVHGDKIKIIKKKDIEQLASAEHNSFTADALISNIKDIVLLIQVADCQAVMLYDRQAKVIANIHSGWRGSILNIIGKAMDMMTKEFGCQAENILAGISPSLGPCCAEFINFRKEIPSCLWQYKTGDTNYFDFWAISCDQLMK